MTTPYFRCPRCGGGSLVNRRILFQHAFLFGDGFVYDDPEPNDLGFCCGECGWEIQEDGQAIVDAKRLIKWLVEKQEAFLEAAPSCCKTRDVMLACRTCRHADRYRHDKSGQ